MPYDNSQGIRICRRPRRDECLVATRSFSRVGRPPVVIVHEGDLIERDSWIVREWPQHFAEPGPEPEAEPES